MPSAKLEAIWIKRQHRGLMEAASTATLQAGKGIVGSVHQGGRRQVTVIEQEEWDRLMREMGASLPPATRRANLMVSQHRLADSAGKILVVGGCRIRMLGETEPCSQMDAALPGLKKAMLPNWSGGAFGEVLTDGTIAIGDQVSWEDHS